MSDKRKYNLKLEEVYAFEVGFEEGIRIGSRRVAEAIDKIQEKEVTEIDYIKEKDIEFYQMLYHEQTLRIGYNQALHEIKTLVEAQLHTIKGDERD
jgi:hypothetical protein